MGAYVDHSLVESTVLEWLWSVSLACRLLLAILPKNRYESIYADSFIK
ncbi:MULTISPECIES: hypothetical protein [unclassified Bartonella]